MDFDSVIDRSGTGSLKWDNPRNRPGVPDIIPLWVADMDFSPPPAVIEALRGRLGHPIYGYTRPPKEFGEAIAAWYASRQGLALDSEDIVLAPAVMPSLVAALRYFTKEGEGAMIMPPVYRPFRSVIEENGRDLIEAPLARGADGGWEMDMARAEAEAEAAERRGAALRAIVVSSPHNPVGRVWTRAELEALRAFARRRGAAIICDEIHSDLILGERKFLSMASFEGEEARDIVVLSGPNKTFNIAGLHISQIIARHEETRAAMRKALSAGGFSLPNAFSLAAALAAYREGAAWLDELIAYLRRNRDCLAGFLAERRPEIGLSPLEGSYLAWLDCRGLIAGRGESGDEELARVLEDKGRVRLSPGSEFGQGGEGFLRLNLATPRTLLVEALGRVDLGLGG